jgi:hypothetical protein
MSQDEVKITIEGQEYSLNDFEGRDIVGAERAFDISLFGELQRNSMTGIYALVYIIRRKTNPRLTVDDVLGIKLGEVENMIAGEEENGNGGPPPKGKAKPKAKSGSSPE